MELGGTSQQFQEELVERPETEARLLHLRSFDLKMSVRFTWNMERICCVHSFSTQSRLSLLHTVIATECMSIPKTAVRKTRA